MNKKLISNKEVKRALEHFRMHGGLIKRLPPEKVSPDLLVGGKHGMFENPLEISQNWGTTNTFF